MAAFESWFRQDLKKPVAVRQLTGNLFSADNAANLIGVEVLNDNVPAEISGAVMGYVIRSDGATVLVQGTLEGNKCSVTLPSSCYAVIGRISIVIKLGTTTVLACTGYVYQASTDAIVDPGSVIPSIDELLAKISEMEAGTAAAEEAATAANTAATDANTKAGLAETAAGNANTAAGKINNMTVAATTLSAGSQATVSVTEVDGHKHIEFGVPKGVSGNETIDDTAGEGDTDKVWSADKSNSEITQLKNNVIVDSASGAIASFPDGADGMPVKTLTVGIEPVQEGSGDPSPENVRPISGWTGANVQRTGVNVWDEEWELGRYDTNTGLPVVANDRIRAKHRIPVLPNATYCFVGGAFVIYWYDANDNYISYSTPDATTPTRTSPNNARFVRFNMTSGYGTTYNDNISVNYPATDTQYHAYSGETAEYSFPSSAGTVYGGTLTIHQDGSGELVVDRANVDLGTLTWQYSEGYARFYSTSLIDSKKYGASELANAKCEMYKVVKREDIETRDNQLSISFDSVNYVNVKNTSFTDATTFTSAMSGAHLVYELATPVTYQLTNQQVVALLKGTNNVWADTGNVTLEYPADTKLYIDGKIAELQALILENISNS